MRVVGRACNGGEWGGVSRGLRKRCVMFPSLFNVFLDKIVRRMNKKVDVRELKLRNQRGLETDQVLHAYDAVLFCGIKRGPLIDCE